MIQYQFGATESGHPIAVVHISENSDPIKMLRAMKQAFPALWQQVNLEIVVAQEQPRVNGVNRILNAEGKTE